MPATRLHIVGTRPLAAFAIAALCVVVSGSCGQADDLVRLANPQRGLWDTAVAELGVRSGILKKHGLTAEILYTQGGPEAYQAIISGSMDISCGGGIEAAIGTYARGAPLRIIGSETVGSPDTYWFVPAASPIRSIKDAGGKTISFSQNGSSSHAALLSLLDQYKVDAKPVATGGHPATLTMAMSGQIDIGRGAAPFGLDLARDGKIRVIARGSEIKERSNQTVRVCVVNAAFLETKRAVVMRFMQAYRDTVDWMYASPDALRVYEEFSGISRSIMVTARDEYFPKATLWPDEVKGLDLTLTDVLRNKFITKPLTPDQIRDMIQIMPPLAH